MRWKDGLNKNIFFNLLGAGIPLLVAIITVPIYLGSIGATRYGVLAMVWLFIGYFGLLDFGISRATVHQISKIPPSDLVSRQKIFWSACWLNSGIGLIAMLLIYPMAFYGIDLINFSDPEIRAELLASVPWLSLLLPLTLISSVGTGALEANDRFDIANSVQIFGAIATQVIPVLVACYIGIDLNLLILAILIARTSSFLLLFVLVINNFQIKKPLMWDVDALRKLIGYGSRASLSAIISTVIEALDRLIIGAKLGGADVAAYAIPLSVTDKLRIIPRSLGRAAFPKLSRLPEGDALVLYRQLLELTLCLMTPMVLVAIYGSKTLLELWIGEHHARDSEIVAIILLAGAWFNAIAVVPFVYLQARGRPGITAKINSIEFLPFILALVIFISHFGIVGAALAWAARMMVDAVFLLFFAPIDKKQVAYMAVAGLVVLFSAYWMSMHSFSWALIAISLGVVLLVFFPVVRSLIKLGIK